MDHKFRRHAVALVLATAACFAPLRSIAAQPPVQWAIPSNVRIVQKDNADNVKIFSDLGRALDSITDSSAQNPYIVKVMPGTFAGAGATLKPYVSVEGSGVGVTTIFRTFLQCSTERSVISRPRTPAMSRTGSHSTTSS